MAESAQKSITEMFIEGTKIDEALARAVQLALWRHKQMGVPIVVWRDGKIVEIPPEEIPVHGPPNGAGEAGAASPPVPRRTVSATYENGVLKPDAPLDLPPDARVRLTVEALT